MPWLPWVSTYNFSHKAQSEWMQEIGSWLDLLCTLAGIILGNNFEICLSSWAWMHSGAVNYVEIQPHSSIRGEKCSHNWDAGVYFTASSSPLSYTSIYSGPSPLQATSHSHNISSKHLKSISSPCAPFLILLFQVSNRHTKPSALAPSSGETVLLPFSPPECLSPSCCSLSKVTDQSPSLCELSGFHADGDIWTNFLSISSHLLYFC